MTTEEIATKYNTNENVKDHQNSILEVLAQRIPQTIDPLSTWIHIPWLSKLRCTEVVIKLFCLTGKLLDQCNIQYPEEISDNCYLHAIVYQKYTLYNLFLFHGLMKREKDHALIRSIA